MVVVLWDIYIIANEQHCTIDSVWDGVDLKITFRRTVSPALFDRWLDLVNLVNSFFFSEEEDLTVWMYHPFGRYSVKSFYVGVNNGGVIPVHIPATWQLDVPPEYMSSCGC